jgi:hypothetical protein
VLRDLIIYTSLLLAPSAGFWCAKRGRALSCFRQALFAVPASGPATLGRVEEPKRGESPVEPTPEISAARESSDPAPSGPPETGSTPPRRRSRWRLVLLVMAAVIGITCVAGLGAGYLFYYKISEPDRSSPTVVVRAYLEAVLNERSDQQAALFSCRHVEDGEIRALLKDVKDREERFGITIRPSWENFEASTHGGKSDVRLDLRLSTTVEGVAQREVQRWEFGVVKQSGWRVCSAKRIS